MVDAHTERFDRLAPNYDRYTRFVEWLLLRRLRTHLLKGASGTVLEIGVGTGRNFEHYAEDVTLFGIDVSEAMLDQAQHRADESNCDVFLNMMDAVELAFPDNTFDTVVSTLTLCSVTNINAALNEMIRVCKPSGKLLLMEHGLSRLGIVNYWLNRTADSHFDEHGCRQNLDMEGILRQTSLDLDETKSYVFGIVKVFWAKPQLPLG